MIQTDSLGDAFISYASEGREAVARHLAELLSGRAIGVDMNSSRRLRDRCYSRPAGCRDLPPRRVDDVRADSEVLERWLVDTRFYRRGPSDA